MPASRRAPVGRLLAPRQKLWLNWDGVFLMGPRYLRFLDAVDRTGTIRAAGQVVGWSYRTCLNRIRQMEREAGCRVELSYLPQPDPPDGARAGRESARHDPGWAGRRRCPSHRRGASPREAV